METILARLQNVKRSGTGWIARCPAHEDKTPSLSISQGESGKPLLHCHAGCSFDSILSAIDLTLDDITPTHTKPLGRDIVAVYKYLSPKGELLYEKLRYQPKSFGYRRIEHGSTHYDLNGTQRVIYNLPSVTEAITKNKPILLVEGEKDADNATKLGFTSTTSADGAGKWRDEYTEQLRGAIVVLCGDNDDPGRAHMAMLEQKLAGVAKSVISIDLPGVAPKGDLSDWIAAGGTADELRSLIASYQPTRFISDVLPLLTRTHTDVAEGRVKPGLSTGIEGLDTTLLGGLKSGDFVVIAARPSHGKTAFLLHLAYEACNNQRKKVFLYSAEQSTDQVVNRLALRYCGFNAYNLVLGFNKFKNMQLWDEFCLTAEHWQLIINDTPQIDVSKISAEMNALKDQKPDLIMVDYLQLLRCKQERSREQEVAAISRMLKAVARSVHVPLVVAVQLNREAEKEENPFRKMAMVRESGAIEADADKLIVLDVPDNDDKLRVTVAKHRNGPCDIHNVTFDKSRQWIKPKGNTYDAKPDATKNIGSNRLDGYVSKSEDGDECLF